MRSASGDLIPPSFVFPLIVGVTIAAVVLTLYCFSVGISTVFMHLYYLPIILIAYFYHRRGIPVFTGLSLFYLAIATFFLYPSMTDIESVMLRTGMFILIGVVVAELSERLEKKKEDYRIAHEYEKSIIDNANVWLMVLDPYGRILGWNRAAEQISGYPAADVIGGNEVWKRLYPEKNYRKEISGKITEIIKKDNFLENLQTTIVSKNGTKKTIVWNTRGLPEDEGNIRNYIAIGVDITDREKVAQVSREYAEWYSTLLRTTHDGYNLVDATGRLIEVNDNYCRMTGFSREELLGRTIFDQDAEESRDVAFAHMQKILATGSDRFETRHRTKGGGAIDVEISVVLQVQKRQLIVFVRDITERKQAEQQVEENSRFLATLIDTLPVPLFYKDTKGKYLGCNPPFEEYIGVPRSELIGKTAYDISPKDLADRYQEADQQVFDNPVPQRYETQIRFADGSRHNVIFYKAPFFNNDGSVGGLIGTFLDITEQKISEEALKQANKQLNLLSSITRHDILNQLMALKGYLELSHEVIDNPKTLIEYIQKEEKAANTIENQITFTRDYQNLGIAAPEWQSVNASINKALSKLPMRDVRVEVDPKNPEVIADRLFEKVFYNLTDNALRYGGEQMTSIRVTTRKDNGNLVIAVEDDGNGISAEDKKRLFTKGFGKNTGLGLFLSREILAITGITITENGTSGKGARFEITVPKGAWCISGVDRKGA